MENLYVRNNELLFKLVWKNIYIRSIIFQQLKISNIYYSTRYFESINGILEFKNKSYLYDIGFKDYIENESLSIKEILPKNIEILRFQNGKIPVIPKWIKSLTINSQSQYPIQSMNIFKDCSTNLESLSIAFSQSDESNDEIIENFPNNLKELCLTNYKFKFSKSTFSNCNNLVKLNLTNLSSTLNLIEKGVLPSNLKELNLLHTGYILPLEEGYIPNSLEKLRIESQQHNLYNNKQDLTFLTQLKELAISVDEFNYKLPKSLKILYLSTLKIRNQSFSGTNTQSLNLEKLYIVQLKNKQPPVELTNKNIPINYLKYLNIFNCTLNQISVLPITIETLIISYGFNERLTKFNNFSKLSNLLHLQLGNHFNNGGHQLIEKNVFPKSLKSLIFGSNFNQIIGENVLSSLNQLETLKFGFHFNQSIDKIGSLPPSLTLIDFGNDFNQSIDIDILPIGLKTIILGAQFNQHFKKGSLPSTLQLIKIENDNYDSYPINLNSISNYSTTYIDCKNYYNKQFLDNNLKTLPPEFLYKLELPIEFNNSLSTLNLNNKINLNYLEINQFYNKPILKQDLPSPNNIKTLVIRGLNDQILNLELFQNLEILIVYSNPIITTTYSPQYKSFNFYNLKKIITKVYNTKFLDSLNQIFYQFIKLENYKSN